MELQVAKKDILRLLLRTQNVADKKVSSPILSTVLLSTDGDSVLRLSATDSYVSMLARVPAEVSKQGSVAVPMKEFVERVRAMPEGPIQLAAKDGSMTVKAKASSRRYTQRGLPGADFPPLPSPAEDASVREIPAALIRDLIDRTKFSISTDETRPHLHSAKVEWEGDIMRMVTTDGHRLTRMQVKLPAETTPGDMLLPHKGVQELRGVCEEALSVSADAVIVLRQSGSMVFFQTDGLVLGVKLVDAQFPPYQQVIPKKTLYQLVLPRLALLDAIKAVAVAASEKTLGVKFVLTNGSLRIQSESPTTGDGYDELSVDHAGPEVTIGFNARYFADVLAALPEPDVELGVSGELDPATVRPHGEKEGHSFVSVVMPMRI